MFAPDQIASGQNVAPLVVAAHLQQTTMALMEHQVIVGLQQLVIEFDERKAFRALKPGAIGVGADHFVDPKMAANVAQKLDVMELEQPIGIVGSHAGIAVKLQVALKLTENAVTVCTNRLK